MRLRRRLPAWLGFALTILLSLGAAAAPQYPALTGRVVDQANLLSPAAEAKLSTQLEGYEQATGNQVVVVTLASLQGYTIEEYGVGLGRAWGIGQKGKDNGLLLIVAPKERAVRFEVGYGLEGKLTDALSRNIIETQILPHFRNGDFEGGILAGTEAALQVLGGSYKPAAAQNDRQDRGSPLFPFLMFAAFFVIAVLNMRYRGVGRRRGFGGPIIVPGGLGGGRRGGGFGGGGFSGGGGSFGGGGATGRW